MKNIPLIDTVTTPLDFAKANIDDVQETLKICQGHYSAPLLKLAGYFSKRAAGKTPMPYKAEMDEMSKLMGGLSAYALNMSYEWACTTQAEKSTDGQTSRLLRAMDWPIRGLSDKTIILRQEGPAGDFFNMTYPGKVGVINAMATGRFSIALNRAPLPDHSWTKVGNMVDASARMLRSGHMPATFLLRQVFEQAKTFEEAKDMIADNAVAVPAIFILAGTKAGEGCVIEKYREKTIVHKDIHTAANHWANTQWRGINRPIADPSESPERLAQMTSRQGVWKGDFDWLKKPVLNDKTRLILEADAARGSLSLVGLEGDKVTTSRIDINDKGAGQTKPSYSAFKIRK